MLFQVKWLFDKNEIKSFFIITIVIEILNFKDNYF